MGPWGAELLPWEKLEPLELVLHQLASVRACIALGLAALAVTVIKGEDIVDSGVLKMTYEPAELAVPVEFARTGFPVEAVATPALNQDQLARRGLSLRRDGQLALPEA